MLRREEKGRGKKGEKGNIVAWLGTLDMSGVLHDNCSVRNARKSNSALNLSGVLQYAFLWEER
jgi:hypothetical protein